MNLPEKKPSATLIIFILLLPYIILYWFVPFLSNLSIGNDYQDYGIKEQMELLFSIKTGSFPLFAPGYAMGQSSIALTWSQIFHPIAYLSYIMPGYWSGKALHWHTFYKILSLGLTHLVLFVFLKRLKLNDVFAFLVSFITVYNLRMLDMIRFGPALEAYTAHLFLCAAIGWFFLYPRKLLGPLGIIVSTYMLIVSGHPQMMYYGLLGSGLFMLVIPFFISTAVFETKPEGKLILNFYGKSTLLLAIGILSASNYVLPFYFDFYISNAVRVGSSYKWGSSGTQSLFGVFSNFFIPFLSDVHGAFGGSSIILLAAIIPVLRLFRIRIPGIIWLLWGIILLILLFMLGQRTPVHKLIWSYLPFMSSFRNPGRISMIMPAFIMLLLSWLVKPREELCRLRNFLIQPYAFLSLIAAILIPLFGIVYLIIKPPLGFLPPIVINKIPFSILLFIVTSGLLSLTLLSINGFSNQRSNITILFLCIITLAQITALLRYGTFIVPVKEWPTLEDKKKEKREKLDYRYHDLPGMQNKAVMSQISHSFIEPFLGKIFTEIIPVKSQMDAYEKMAASRQPHQLFIENYAADRAKEISENAKTMKKGKVDLMYSSFNRLKFSVYSESPAFFGLSYPYTGHWKAWVNGNRVEVYRANGAAHAVEIPAGKSVVEFRYWSSAFFWGMLVSCVTFMITGLTAAARLRQRGRRLSIMLLIIIAGTGLFGVWYGSLYKGENLGTQYSWTYRPPGKAMNLAYGKETSGYELPSTSWLSRHRSTAVDGNRRPGSGFTLEPAAEKAYLVIDLRKAERISLVLLYGKSESPPEISLSNDGRQWFVPDLSRRRLSGKPDCLGIEMKERPTARFVRLRPADTPLSIDEVEIYDTLEGVSEIKTLD
jgi:hypothetical protein